MFCGGTCQLIAKNICKTLIGIGISDAKIGILVQLHFKFSQTQNISLSNLKQLQILEFSINVSFKLGY